MALQLGLGSIVKLDDDDSGSGFTSWSLTVEATPPSRKRRKIPSETLGDTLATYKFGIEDYSELKFLSYCEINDTQHAALRTLFAAKTQFLVNITYVSGDVEQAEYVISDIDSRPFGVDSLLSEEITLQRMGALAYS